MYEVSKKLIELRISARRALMCEPDKNKALISLKTKLLFILLPRRKSPAIIMQELRINKANLAILTKGIIAEGLIKKVRDELDKREITYELTPGGEKYVCDRLEIIEKSVKNAFPDGAEYAEAAEKLEGALHILSFLTV